MPARGFRPVYYLLAVGAIMTYGFIKLGKGIREQKYSHYPTTPPLQTLYPLLSPCCSNTDTDDSELAREKIWSRIYLIPLLQAEEDRDLVRRHYADKAREKALLGSETNVYNSDRYVRLFAMVAQLAKRSHDQSLPG